MLDAPPRGLGFEVIADGGGEAFPPMGRCDGQRSKKPHRLVEFEAANAGQGAVRFDYHKAVEVPGDAGGRESCGLKEFGDRREVTWLCGSCHDAARRVQRHAFHQRGAKRAVWRGPSAIQTARKCGLQFASIRILRRALGREQEKKHVSARCQSERFGGGIRMAIKLLHEADVLI